MDVAEFDRFAEEYLAAHKQNLRISGEEPDYFARYKIELVAERWRKAGRAAPEAVLDFGCGIGASLPHLREAFPGAHIIGLDVSQKSFEIAGRRFPDAAELTPYDGGRIPLADASLDLAFSACVFHHIDAGEHARLFAELRRVLKPDGVLCIFEHNPINPVTRHIVATCPFDENAVLIGASELEGAQTAGGFLAPDITYTGFFPAALKALRPLEPLFGWLPVGAQYYTWTEGRPQPRHWLKLAARYGLAGLANTGLGFAVIAALDLGLGLNAQLANAAGFAVGVVLSFLLNRLFVFRSKTSVKHTGPKYLAAVAIAFAANQGVLAGLHGLLPASVLGRLAAQAAGVATYTLLLFALASFWVFSQPAGRTR